MPIIVDIFEKLAPGEPPTFPSKEKDIFTIEPDDSPLLKIIEVQRLKDANYVPKDLWKFKELLIWLFKQFSLK